MSRSLTSLSNASPQRTALLQLIAVMINSLLFLAQTLALSVLLPKWLRTVPVRAGKSLSFLYPTLIKYLDNRIFLASWIINLNFFLYVNQVWQLLDPLRDRLPLSWAQADSWVVSSACLTAQISLVQSVLSLYFVALPFHHTVCCTVHSSVDLSKIFDLTLLRSLVCVVVTSQYWIFSATSQCCVSRLMYRRWVLLFPSSLSSSLYHRYITDLSPCLAWFVSANTSLCVLS